MDYWIPDEKFEVSLPDSSYERSTYFATCLVEHHDLTARVDLEPRVNGSFDELSSGNPSVDVEVELSEKLVSRHLGCLLEFLLY